MIAQGIHACLKSTDQEQQSETNQIWKLVKNKLICKLPRKNTLQIKQSIEDTRGDQPSNLIPRDKDHAGDP
jgi:hypothetical protein